MLEIISPVSELLVAFAGIGALILSVMLFAYYLGGLMTSLFEG
jgi:hypothetical protein